MWGKNPREKTKIKEKGWKNKESVKKERGDEKEHPLKEDKDRMERVGELFVFCVVVVFGVLVDSKVM